MTNISGKQELSKFTEKRYLCPQFKGLNFHHLVLLTTRNWELEWRVCLIKLAVKGASEILPLKLDDRGIEYRS
jgi:hypothetical protein